MVVNHFPLEPLLSDDMYIVKISKLICAAFTIPARPSKSPTDFRTPSDVCCSQQRFRSFPEVERRRKALCHYHVRLWQIYFVQGRLATCTIVFVRFYQNLSYFSKSFHFNHSFFFQNRLLNLYIFRNECFFNLIFFQIIFLIFRFIVKIVF